MDLTQNRKALGSAGAAIGFGLLVAWMMPPTQPRAAAPNWRANIKPTAPPAPVDFAGFAPAIAGVASSPVEQAAYVGDEAQSVEPAANGVTVYRDRPISDDSEPAAADGPDDRYTALRAAPPPPMQGYRDGYRWGQSHEASRRDCRGAPSDAAEDGCLAYVNGQRDGDFAPDDDQEASQYGPDHN